MDFERWVPYPDRVTDVPADEPSEGTTLACSNCGMTRGKERPVPKEDVQDIACNISETLDMKEIEHCQDTLLNEVQDRNDSDNQGRQDSHVFAPAVETAIRRVQ